MILRRTIVLAMALAAQGLGRSAAAGQQPDSARSVHRALERFPRGSGVRLHLERRRVTGELTRLTADTAYVAGFDWPVAVPLAAIDTVWQRMPGDQHWRPVALMSAAAGAVLGVYGAAALCGMSDSYPPPNCTWAPVGGALIGAVFVGSVGAFLGGLGSRPAHWERRFP